MEFHDAASIFPLLIGNEFNALAEDIREHGLRVPIVTLDGKILDGRNRFRACEAAEVEPIFEEWTKGGDPVDVVLSLNLHRRQLDKSQRAMIAAKVANLTRGGPGGARISDTSRDVSPISQPAAAARLDVSVPIVQRAGRVIREAPEEVVQAIERGERTVGDALREIRETKKPPRRYVRRRKAPSQGMAIARSAAGKMNEIREDDTERADAFIFMRRWLDANED